MPADAATLIDFAKANDAAAATTKKLQKQAILSDYFRVLDEMDLRLAVRYAAGRAFASTDERVLAAGGAIVSDVVLELLDLDPHDYHDLVVRSGEIGEALSLVWRPGLSTGDNTEPLTLQELATAFDGLASSGARDHKSRVLRELFSRCATGREATYLAKIIFGDMRTGVQEGVLQAAVAQAFGKTLAQIQRCQLLVGDLDEVAVLAKRDALDVARFRLFHPIQFMLATPQETAEDAAATMDGRAFYAEDKLDGIRAQVHKSAEGRVAIYTRTMDRTDASFPDVVDAISKLPGEFLLDGEIVPYRDGVVLPFAHIQRRLGRKVLTPKIVRDNPTVFVAFDVLYKDGELLMDCALRDRRIALARLCAARAAESCERPATLGEAPQVDPPGSPGSPLLLTTDIQVVSTPAEIATAFDAARARRNEGTVLKNPDSSYTPGRRGQMWLKIKTHLPTLDCVVTAAEYGHGKRRKWLSDYTFAVWDRDPALPGAALVNIGKAYSGVTDEEITQLTELFLKLSREVYAGRVHVVEPKVVFEIACDQIQASARHSSGYALRFPRIKRVRWDKRPEDADRLERVVEIYRSAPNTAHPIATPVSTEDDEVEEKPPKPRRSRKAKPETQEQPSLFDGV